MGKRLRLARGLADGTLTGAELEEAQANSVIVKQAKAFAKPEIVRHKRKVKKNG